MEITERRRYETWNLLQCPDGRVQKMAWGAQVDVSFNSSVRVAIEARHRKRTRADRHHGFRKSGRLPAVRTGAFFVPVQARPRYIPGDRKKGSDRQAVELERQLLQGVARRTAGRRGGRNRRRAFQGVDNQKQGFKPPGRRKVAFKATKTGEPLLGRSRDRSAL